VRAVFSLLPLVAAVLAVPQFLPQLARLARTGETAGVSWSWAALTSINNAAWAGHLGDGTRRHAGRDARPPRARVPAPPHGARPGVDRATHHRRQPVRPRGP